MSGVVLVVGSINADDAIRVARLPGPGETVSASSVTSALGGKGANQAVAAARAGATVRMVGAVGASDGEPLVAALSAGGVGTAGIARVEGRGSGRAIVLIDDAGENSIVVDEAANGCIPLEAVERACAALGDGDVLLLQHEVPTAVSRRAAEVARAAGAAVLWNAAPAPTSPDQLLHVDVLIVNEHELAAIADLLEVPAGPLAARLPAVAAMTGAEIVCTLGGDGAAYLVGGEAGTAPARTVNVVDTTAAGDTFVGYLAALASLPFAERLRFALAAGSLTVTRHGAAASIPHLAEVERSLGLAPLDRSRA